MRVTSDFFVSALIRKTFTAGGFAAVSRRGAAEAGAIFIVVDRLDGSLDLYGPAPQAMFVELPQGRLFEQLLKQAPRDDVTARLQREERLDPDYWVVEIEARDGKIELPLAEDDGEEKDDPGKGLFRR